MSHNPNRAAGASRKKARRNNPHAGHRRRRPTTPQGVDYGDIHSRSITDRGWKVEYFGGDDFEVVYELIAAGNATGKIKNDDADRTVRVLEGILYVLVPGSLPAEVRKNQVCTFPKGTEYELSSSMHGDVEVLFCQGAKYEAGIEVIEPPGATNSKPLTEIPIEAERPPRSDGSRAQATAEKIREGRKSRKAARTPVPKKNPDGSPAGEGRSPLAGQNVTGVSPKPIGPGGYAE